MNYHLLLSHIASACQSVTGGSSCTTGLPIVGADKNTLPSILSIVFGIAGALAVLMIVIGGLRFVIGQGNPQEMAKARNTIVYALIGLLIALTAEGIVAFVLGKL